MKTTFLLTGALFFSILFIGNNVVFAQGALCPENADLLSYAFNGADSCYAEYTGNLSNMLCSADIAAACNNFSYPNYDEGYLTAQDCVNGLSGWNLDVAYDALSEYYACEAASGTCTAGETKLIDNQPYYCANNAWLPTKNQGQSCTANFQCASNSCSTTCQGNDPYENEPNFTSVGSQSVSGGQIAQFITAIGQAFSFSVSATSPTGSVLTTSALNLPAGANFDASAGTFSWTPAAGQTGATILLFTATDSAGRSGSVPVLVTVSASSTTATTLDLKTSATSVNLGQAVSITWAAGGADSCTSVSAAKDTLPAVWTSPATSGGFSFTPTGVTNLTLTCTGQGGTVSKTVSISVDALHPVPPVITTAVTPPDAAPGQNATVTWSTSGADSCTGTGGSADWNKTLPASGFWSFIPSQDTTLTLSCTGAGGTATSLISVNVLEKPLSAVCSAAPGGTAYVNHQLVTYTATASGGYGYNPLSYSYTWSGSENLTGSAPAVSVYYASVGTKTASVTVVSGNQTQTVACPSVQILYENPGQAPHTTNGPTLSSLSPSSGPIGTTISLSGVSNYQDNATAAVIQSGSNTFYAKLFIGTDGKPAFLFYPPSAFPTAPGTVYTVALQNYAYMSANQYFGFSKSASFNFTLTAPVAAVSNTPAPTIASLSPASGPAATTLTVNGSGFNSNTVFVLTQNKTTLVIPKNSFTATSASLTLHAGQFSIFGDISVTALNNGSPSNALIYRVQPPAALPAFTPSYVAPPVQHAPEAASAGTPPPPAAPGAASSNTLPNPADLLSGLITLVVNPLIYLLIGVAAVVFLWGLVEFVARADDMTARANGRRHLLWGITGLLIIFSVYGILNVIQNTLVSLFL